MQTPLGFTMIQRLFAIVVMVAFGVEAQAQGICEPIADVGDQLVRVNQDGTGFIDIGDTDNNNTPVDGADTIEASSLQPDTKILYASVEAGDIGGSATGQLGVVDRGEWIIYTHWRARSL